MAKGLNFRNFAQPTLPINMNDAEETLFNITAPTVELVERLDANKDMMLEVLEAGDRSSLNELWKLAADLISCNREHRQVCADDLKGRYGMDYQMLFAFFVAYIEFIDEIKREKN